MDPPGQPLHRRLGDGHGIVIRPVAHQGQRADPRALLVARVERCRQWPLQRFAVTHKPFADALAVNADAGGLEARRILDRLLEEQDRRPPRQANAV